LPNADDGASNGLLDMIVGEPLRRPAGPPGRVIVFLDSTTLIRGVVARYGGEEDM
jgi:hypothetical protein